MITKDILDVIYKDLKYNKSQLEIYKNELTSLPPGKIHYKASKHQNTRYFQYMCTKSHSNKKEQVYIRRANIVLKSLLAKKAYVMKCIENLEKTIAHQIQFLNSFIPYDPVSVFESIPKQITDLYIEPTPQIDNYKLRWAEETHEQSQLYPKNLIYHSPNGVKVRSKSESIIAGLLEAEGIPFRYEAVLRLDEVEYYPDFTILCPRNNNIVYWEHFGMADKPEYAISMNDKILVYRRNGIFPWQNLIETYETEKMPFDTQLVRMIIQRFLLP